MDQAKRQRFSGFSLIEMVVAIAIVSITILGVGVFLSNGQRSWNDLFSRVYSDSTIDGFAVQRVFDSICRKASMRKATIGEDGDFLELYYWDSGSTASTPEHYARFYLSNDDLYVEHGTLLSGTWQPDADTAHIKVAEDIEDLKFGVQGASIQMYMTYQDEGAMPVVCSTVRHSE